MAKLMLVIFNESTRGDGDRTPIRRIVEYWSTDGELLAVHDPCAPLYTTWAGAGDHGEYFQATGDVEVKPPEKKKRGQP